MNKNVLLTLAIVSITAVMFADGSFRFAHAQNDADNRSPRVLTLEEYINGAIENDTAFQAILINEMALKYQKDLRLPARDIVLDVQGQYDFVLDQDREDPEATIALSKLFPNLGTTVGAEYSTRPSWTEATSSSDMELYLTQPIAQNAFGRATRLLDDIIGLENDVAKHQIVEAYEDYLATIITAYYNWYEAYENMLIGQSSYNENVKLLDNMKERENSKIAKPVDVNKTSLQVYAKQETLIGLTETYNKTLNVITTALRYRGAERLVPKRPSMYDEVIVSFERDFKELYENGRTFQVLKLLEEKSSLDVSKNADDLLPSIELLVGYKIQGDEYEFESGENMLYTGFSFSYPFFDQVERAQHGIAKVEEEKSQITTDNVYYRLYRDIRNLALGIEREQELLALADEKIKLSEAVLEDETKNYTYGKITLNDYIDAVNRRDNNLFNKITRISNLKRLKIDWLRLNDKLVQRSDMSTKYQWEDKPRSLFR
ncbi:MAG: TolC family protein [Candidatus Omnitrophica bacterium]|nr:TolC family protein [Candidatus Omnitrophota bacterium]